MARRRDVLIGVIIVAFTLVAIVLFGIALIGMFSPEADLGGIAGIGGNVGVVEVFGVIDEAMGRRAIYHLDRWRRSSAIKAIVIHVNSPGGGVAISQELYDAIMRTREEKPVVASFASVAASGGYYVACGADRIVANPGTLTGSIGVLIQYHTMYDLMEKVGIGTETVKSGELKDAGSYSKPLPPEAELMFRSVVMDSYEQFVRTVAEGRGLSVDDVYPLADGSIYTGLQAYNLGLVDTLGGLYEAVEIAADLAGITGEPEAVHPMERREVTLFDLLGGLAKAVTEPIQGLNIGPELMYLYR